MNQLQEVLDKIKATESKNEAQMQALRQKMKDYELELQHKYEDQLSQNKDEVKTFIETTEAKKQESLTREARKLAKEVATTKQHLETSYQENAQMAVAQVIEKVMVTYDSH